MTETLEPVATIVRKRQRRLSRVDEIVLSLLLAAIVILARP
ncbi:hypothetical protein [Pseudonocardia spinosispora]|nr:hypothetical protein [Pseudonocardia spinosispora]